MWKRCLKNSDHTELKDLKQQIESLAMIMKGPTVRNIKPKMGNGAPSPRKKEVSSNSPCKPPKGLVEDLRGLELVLQKLLDLGKNL